MHFQTLLFTKQKPVAVGRGEEAFLLPGPGLRSIVSRGAVEAKVGYTWGTDRKLFPAMGEQELRKHHSQGPGDLVCWDWRTTQPPPGAQNLMSPVSVHSCWADAKERMLLVSAARQGSLSTEKA